ncbi:DNA polymerase alpha subunit B [Diorhabda carinulata]|uniref:DNA polymerase alpha subunit B n=1 Tax=Diorhabda carinulata TaxID=1163345 RepID=UPI0025A10EB8|nr:DNA polymerase alpha subunit B [Diorhabda carinulata]
MTSIEEIKSYFQELNIVVNDAILNKCLELCATYNIDAEDFCDQWYAFTASNLNGAPPTIEDLEKMERKEFIKYKDHSLTKSNVSKQSHDIEGDRIKNYAEAAVLTPKAKVKENAGTPTSKIIHENKSNINTPVSIKSSEKFNKRKDSGSVQNSYGSVAAKFKRDSNVVLSVNEVQSHKIPTDIRYMYEIMGKKKRIMNNMIRDLGHEILDKYGMNLSDGVLISQMGDMVTYGRIVSDADGKINSQSILLEGTDETNLNHTTRLNISKLSSYSLFPGQVVAVKGNNVKNLAFVAERLYSDAVLDLPENPPIVNGSIQIIVAAGPFTFKENLSYEPLHELLKYVLEHEPHVLILLGPFLDSTHEGILTGQLTQTFDSFFEELIENLMISLQHLDTRVVIVSNLKDAHHHPVYPTPPYRTRENYNKLTFVSDPAVIEIDGLVMAITTADILFHMSNYELHYDKESVIKSGRMERLISHLLSQKNLYPLYPPRKELNVDHVLLEQFGTLKNKPHILVLPSNLKNFIKEVNDCLVINPEKLTKGFEAGTFARIEIESGSSKSICGRAAVQILKV